MIGIPSDITKAAHAAYDHPVRDDGASLNSMVNKDIKEAVLAALEYAILQERRRNETQGRPSIPGFDNNWNRGSMWVC